jgi:four helix bundle protein
LTIEIVNRKSKGVMMDKQQFQKRTKQLAIHIIKMSNTLPNTMAADVIGRQIIRSSSSVGSNNRAACRAKSTADMINKLKIVEEEADETSFWLEVLVEADIMPESHLKDLLQETDEILAMTVASLKTLRQRSNKS